MIFGLLLLPVAILLLLLAGLSVRMLIADLWAEGSLQVCLGCIALLAVWILCSAIRGWWEARQGTAKPASIPGAS